MGSKSVIKIIGKRKNVSPKKILHNTASVKKIKFTNAAENPIMVSDDIIMEKPDYHLTTTNWLSDAHIDMAIDYFMKTYSPEFQMYNCYRLMDIYRHQEVFIPEDRLINQLYLINSNNTHWFLLTNVDITVTEDANITEYGDTSFIKREWFVYDSLNDTSTRNLSSLIQLFKKIYPDRSCMYVKCVKCEKQVGFNDCGLFALAYAQSIMNRKDPALLKYNQSKMRSIYNTFIDTGFLSYFPADAVAEKCRVVEDCLIEFN